MNDDWDLFFAWRDGDEEAAERLISRYFRVLTRFFRSKISDDDVVTDLVAETLLACTKNRDRATAQSSFRSYLFAIAMNKLRVYRRCQAKRQREIADFRAVCITNIDPPTPPKLVARIEEVQLLVRALRRLNTAQQTVLQLYYFEGLRGPQIAAQLDIPLPTVYTLVRRGLARLERLIAEIAECPARAGSTADELDGWIAEVRATTRGT